MDGGARSVTTREKIPWGRRLRRWAFRLAVMGVLTFLAGEAVIRVTGPVHVRWYTGDRIEQFESPGGRFVWEGTPGLLREFSNPVQLNALGYHDVDHAEGPRTDAVRIAVIGDSYVDALQVPLERCFFRLLEDRLRDRRVEVIAAGRGGAGPSRELKIVRQIVHRYRPDVVLLAFHGHNDVMAEDPTLFERQKQFVSGLAYPFGCSRRHFPLRHSSLLAALAGMANQYLSQRSFEADGNHPFFGVYWRNHPDAAWESAWVRTFEVVSSMAERCHAEGARFGVVYVPSSFEVNLRREGEERWPGPQPRPSVEAEWDVAYPSLRMEAYCRQNGFAYCDLTPTLAARSEALYFRWDGHWNEAGHRVVAERLREFVIEEKLLEPRP